MQIIGHRGAGSLLPENTIEAFKYACNAKIGIETDIWKTKCGNFIIYHGKATREEATVNGMVWPPDFEAKVLNQKYGLPVVEDLLSLLQRSSSYAVLELKGNNWSTGSCQDFSKRVLDHKIPIDQFIISSSNYHALTCVPSGIRVACTFGGPKEDWRQVVQMVGASKVKELHFNSHRLLKNPELVPPVLAAGYEIMVWSLMEVKEETEDELRCLQAAGITSVCVNRPDTVHRLLTTTLRHSAFRKGCTPKSLLFECVQRCCSGGPGWDKPLPTTKTAVTARTGITNIATALPTTSITTTDTTLPTNKTDLITTSEGTQPPRKRRRRRSSKGG